MKEFFEVFAVVFLILIVALGVVKFLQSLGTDCLPISGRVVEMLEIHDGYGNVSHALKLEIAEGRYVRIAVSSKVYMSVVEGVYYEFDGPKSGTSYDSVTRDGD